MFRNMASSLVLTERDAELDDNEPKVKGRIVTTMPKAKEVRPIIERCITIAKRSLPHSEAAEQFASDADRSSDEWKSWRKSDNYKQWSAKIAPAVAARRRVLRMLGDKEAVSIVFDDLAPRFVDRPGGYTRIMRLATPRLGDAGQRVILEFVGVHDREVSKSEKPAFDAPADEVVAEEHDEAVEEQIDEDEASDVENTEDVTSEQASSEEASAEEGEEPGGEDAGDDDVKE